MRDFKLLDSMVTYIQKGIKKASPSELAEVASAYGKCWSYCRNSETVLRWIASEAVRMISQFSPNDLTLLAWSFASCGLADKTLFTEVAAAATWRMDEFGTQ